MLHFTPTLGIKDTAKNAKSFVKEHQSELWKLVKKLAPFIILGSVLSTCLQYMVMQEMSEAMKTVIDASTEQKDAPLDDGELSEILETSLETKFFKYEVLGYGINIMMSYIFSVIAISWHRLVIHGPDKYEPMNIMNPQKHELHYMLLIILSSVVAPILIGVIVEGAMAINPTLGISGLFLAIAYIYGIYKICFLFPASAINAPLSVSQSFNLTKGYFWKFSCASFLAIILIILGMFVLLLIMGVVIGPATIAAHQGGAIDLLSLPTISLFVLSLPIMLYFAPLMTVLLVTVLSNYYQHAVQNKGLYADD